MSVLEADEATRHRSGPGGTGPGAAPSPGTVLVAVGAFLLTLAALLPLYVHDRVALLPAEAEFDVRMVDDGGAWYLDTSTWSWVEAPELTRTTRVDASAHGGDWSAWEVSVDTAVPDRMIDHWSRRVIVDRETGRAVNCCGEHVDGDRAVRQAGLVFFWPPGAEEGDHPFYDAEVRAAPSVEFRAEEEVAGVPVRRYEQTIGATQVPDSARPVPADLFRPGAAGTVTATRWLEVRRTFWVEPVSGTVVNAHETRSETLRPRNDSGEAPLLYAELAMVDHQVSAYAEQARVRSVLLLSLGSWAPWTLAPLGALAVLAGVVRAWRARNAAEKEEGRVEPGNTGVPGEDGPATS
ncbi:hypothetical protein A6A08_11445 [Nocardiopsis sp. TSRI0078]|uniref:DUF3068 domain-containing protein n=1 Tax=unclassified Nocardiopsis TaxID=2649073 RepID=UPI00093FEE72|nr:DUF3068 domain-containing protein [Nocardiopsis sp. TSRI0078]OKI15134.1 hypothetical protein A6A08_11445 [Nocardiopsis sp. TSRI0078]